eukprot:jgi/Mesvir1/8646/Mv02590-RA.1
MFPRRGVQSLARHDRAYRACRFLQSCRLISRDEGSNVAVARQITAVGTSPCGHVSPPDDHRRLAAATSWGERWFARHFSSAVAVPILGQAATPASPIGVFRDTLHASKPRAVAATPETAAPSPPACVPADDPPAASAAAPPLNLPPKDRLRACLLNGDTAGALGAVQDLRDHAGGGAIDLTVSTVIHKLCPDAGRHARSRGATTAPPQGEAAASRQLSRLMAVVDALAATGVKLSSPAYHGLFSACQCWGGAVHGFAPALHLMTLMRRQGVDKESRRSAFWTLSRMLADTGGGAEHARTLLAATRGDDFRALSPSFEAHLLLACRDGLPGGRKPGVRGPSDVYLLQAPVSNQQGGGQVASHVDALPHSSDPAGLVSMAHDGQLSHLLDRPDPAVAYPMKFYEGGGRVSAHPLKDGTEPKPVHPNVAAAVELMDTLERFRVEQGVGAGAGTLAAAPEEGGARPGGVGLLVGGDAAVRGGLGWENAASSTGAVDGSTTSNSATVGVTAPSPALILSARLHNVALVVAAHAGDLDGALFLACRMADRGLPRDAYTYQALLAACGPEVARRRRAAVTLEHIWREVQWRAGKGGQGAGTGGSLSVAAPQSIHSLSTDRSSRVTGPAAETSGAAPVAGGGSAMISPNTSAVNSPAAAAAGVDLNAAMAAASSAAGVNALILAFARCGDAPSVQSLLLLAHQDRVSVELPAASAAARVLASVGDVDGISALVADAWGRVRLPREKGGAQGNRGQGLVATAASSNRGSASSSHGSSSWPGDGSAAPGSISSLPTAGGEVLAHPDHYPVHGHADDCYYPPYNYYPNVVQAEEAAGLYLSLLEAAVHRGGASAGPAAWHVLTEMRSRGLLTRPTTLPVAAQGKGVASAGMATAVEQMAAQGASANAGSLPPLGTNRLSSSENDELVSDTSNRRHRSEPASSATATTTIAAATTATATAHRSLLAAAYSLAVRAQAAARDPVGARRVWDEAGRSGVTLDDAAAGALMRVAAEKEGARAVGAAVVAALARKAALSGPFGPVLPGAAAQQGAALSGAMVQQDRQPGAPEPLWGEQGVAPWGGEAMAGEAIRACCAGRDILGAVAIARGVLARRLRAAAPGLVAVSSQLVAERPSWPPLSRPYDDASRGGNTAAAIVNTFKSKNKYVRSKQGGDSHADFGSKRDSGRGIGGNESCGGGGGGGLGQTHPKELASPSAFHFGQQMPDATPGRSPGPWVLPPLDPLAAQDLVIAACCAKGDADAAALTRNTLKLLAHARKSDSQSRQSSRSDSSNRKSSRSDGHTTAAAALAGWMDSINSAGFGGAPSGASDLPVSIPGIAGFEPALEAVPGTGDADAASQVVRRLKDAASWGRARARVWERLGGAASGGAARGLEALSGAPLGSEERVAPGGEGGEQQQKGGPGVMIGPGGLAVWPGGLIGSGAADGGDDVGGDGGAFNILRPPPVGAYAAILAEMSAKRDPGATLLLLEHMARVGVALDGPCAKSAVSALCKAATPRQAAGVAAYAGTLGVPLDAQMVWAMAMAASRLGQSRLAVRLVDLAMTRWGGGWEALLAAKRADEVSKERAAAAGGESGERNGGVDGGESEGKEGVTPTEPATAWESAVQGVMRLPGVEIGPAARPATVGRAEMGRLAALAATGGITREMLVGFAEVCRLARESQRWRLLEAMQATARSSSSSRDSKHGTGSSSGKSSPRWPSSPRSSSSPSPFPSSSSSSAPASDSPSLSSSRWKAKLSGKGRGSRRAGAASKGSPKAPTAAGASRS